MKIVYPYFSNVPCVLLTFQNYNPFVRDKIKTVIIHVPVVMNENTDDTNGWNVWRTTMI